jgi:hypothetical protein
VVSKKEIVIVKKWLKYYNMAAVTGTIVALGGLGLSAAQAIKANKDMKTASQAAQKASQELKNIKEFNAFKQVQVPTLGFDLAQQSKAQATTQAVEAAKAAGAEGAAALGGILEAGFKQDLDIAAQAGEAKFKRDAMQAEAEQAIEAGRQERELIIGLNETQGAQQQRVAAEERKNAAIEGMFTSAGSALESGAKALSLYGKKTKS